MLDRLTPRPGSRRAAKRVGRGIGSGDGRTCGRGQKGAGARSGSKRRGWLEGGQLPISRRLPKFGFTPLSRVPNEVVNLKDLARFDVGATIDPEVLSAAGLCRARATRVKVLGEGEIKAALTVRAHAVSASARKKIEAAGGTVEILASRAKGPSRKPDGKAK